MSIYSNINFLKRISPYLNMIVYLILIIIFTSCGGGGSSSESTTTTTVPPPTMAAVITGDEYGTSQTDGVRADYSVLVSDDSIVGAKLLATAYVDVNGKLYRLPVCDSFTDLGSGMYTLNNCSQKPEYIFAFGGFVDKNGNNALDTDETTQTNPLILNMAFQNMQYDDTRYALTPLTTLITEVDRATVNTLINKLGFNSSNVASTKLFFGINSSNMLIRHATSAIFAAMTDSGIHIQDISADLVSRINSSSSTGISAIVDAITYIKDNPTAYEAKYGKSQIQSFLKDSRTQAVLTSDDDTIVSKMLIAKVRMGKIRINGMVNTYLQGSNIIDFSTIKLYVDANSTPLVTASSDRYGKYSFEIDENDFPLDNTLVIVAEKNGLKLTSTMSSKALWDRRINSNVNSTFYPDVTVNYVTNITAKIINPNQSARTTKKIIFDASSYTSKNASNERFFVPMTVLYESQVLPYGPDAAIDTAFLTKYAKMLPNTSVPYVLDLETWNFGTSTETYDVLREKVEKYIIVVDAFKNARPDLRFGYFGLLPQVSLLESSFNADYTYKSFVLERMDLRYENTKDLADHVDILFPEMYTYWPESQSYAFTSRVNTGIDVYAQKYNKPVIPFIWPAYMAASGYTEGTFLSDTYWKLEFDKIYNDTNIHASAIWGQKITWDETKYWWQYVKSIIAE